MRTLAAFVFVLGALATTPAVQARDGVLARCGASGGQAYYFYDEVINPEGPGWLKDGVANGQIVLVRLGDEWDVQFDDAIGAYGYREDGAVVLSLGSTETMPTVGAFSGTYVDTFTFNFVGGEVAVSANRVGAGA